jgi:hypothetical protein
MLTIAETKLDESFNSAQFQIENFHLWRADRTANDGGLLTYIRSDEFKSPSIRILSYFTDSWSKVCIKSLLNSLSLMEGVYKVHK